MGLRFFRETIYQDHRTYILTLAVRRAVNAGLIIIIIIIIIQHLYSAMESEDTEALGGARLRHVKQMSF